MEKQSQNEGRRRKSTGFVLFLFVSVIFFDCSGLENVYKAFAVLVELVHRNCCPTELYTLLDE